MSDADFRRYLRAKRTVDDRALDRRLVDLLRSELAALATDGPLRVLEVGAGVGTMPERLLSWDVLPVGETRYTAVDLAPPNVRAIRRRLPEWAADREGWTATGDGDTVWLDGPDRTLVVEAVAAEATAFVADADRTWDLLIGAALLDLVDLDRLPALLSALRPGGLWYFPLTFDGGTRFEPSLPADRAVERYYHRHMDAKPGGDSRAGSHALRRLRATDGASVLAVAGSDWIVRPDGDGYPGDEAYFLEYLLGTVGDAVAAVDRGDDLTDDDLSAWLDARRRHLAAADLVYLTHQLDLLGRVSPPVREAE